MSVIIHIINRHFARWEMKIKCMKLIADDRRKAGQ